MAQWIGHAVVLAVVGVLAVVPWALAAVRAQRRAHNDREALGAALGSLEGHAGRTVALAGRLEIRSQPCDAFDGGRVAATTAHCRGGKGGRGRANERAPALVLVTDAGDAVAIDGPVEVRAGCRERQTRWRIARLPKPIRSRILSSASGGELELEPPGSASGLDLERGRVSIRSVEAGSRVRALGRLVRDPRGESGADYRTQTGTWRLTGSPGPDADDVRPVAVASERAPRVRPIARELAFHGAVVAGLVLVALPWALGAASDKRERVNDSLRDCDPSGFEAARSADRILETQGLFPGWTPAAQRGRASLIGAITNGVAVCDRIPPPGLVDRAANFAAARLPALAGSEVFDRARTEVETFLHERGRDRRIVELAEVLPGGGEVEMRVRAYLSLGDLEGAADVWRHEGARSSSPSRYPPGTGIDDKGNVLCMAGDYAAALEAFEERRASYRNDYRSRKVFLERYTECLRRAGKLEPAERLADELALAKNGDAAAAYLRALIAEDRGDVDAALDALEPHHSRGAHHVLALALLAKTDRADAALRLARNAPPLAFRVETVGRELYSHIHQPAVDEHRLQQVADFLVEASDEVDLESADDGDDAPPRETARELAGRYYFALALRQARRLDPRADANFDRALSLRPDDARLRGARRVLAFIQGDWDVPNDQDDDLVPGLRLPFAKLRAAYRGERAIEIADPALPKAPIAIRASNPFRLDFETGLESMYDAQLTDRQRLEFLRAHQFSTERWPSIFYVLTNLVVHGRHLGFDMSEREAQIEALRALFDAEPNHILLTGVYGDARL